VLAKFLTVYNECDQKAKVKEEFNKNITHALQKLQLDPDQVEQELKEHKQQEHQYIDINLHPSGQLL